jgi:paraquat-inducible protein A
MMTDKDRSLVACPSCDLLHRREVGKAPGVARCVRCATLLYRSSALSLDRPLALAISGLILLLLANLHSFLILDMEGRVQETVLVSGMLTLFHQGFPMLAILVLLTGLICPGFYLGGMVAVLLSLKLGRQAPALAWMYRRVHVLEPWAMVEIFLLGILVAMVKLTGMAFVKPGLAFYAFLGVMFILPATAAGTDPEDIWDRIVTPKPISRPPGPV